MVYRIQLITIYRKVNIQNLYKINKLNYDMKYKFITIHTVKPLYKKLFFFSTFFLIERFSYKEVFTFPMILRINL